MEDCSSTPYLRWMWTESRLVGFFTRLFFLTYRRLCRRCSPAAERNQLQRNLSDRRLATRPFIHAIYVHCKPKYLRTTPHPHTAFFSLPCCHRYARSLTKICFGRLGYSAKLHFFNALHTQFSIQLCVNV